MNGKEKLRRNGFRLLSIVAALSMVCALLLFAVAVAADDGAPSVGPEGVDCYWAGYKFKDLDADGSNREAGEPYLGGWTIKLKNETTGAEFTAVTQTGSDLGYWAFPDNLPGSTYYPRTYLVSEVLQAGWTQTHPDTNGGVYRIKYKGYGSFELLSAPPTGYVAGKLNFGNARPGSIGDCVWHDDDRDGNGPQGCTVGPVYDSGESVIPNVDVQLVIKTGTNTIATVATTTTDGNGNYLFTDLDAGDYIVDVLEPGVLNYFGGPFVRTTTEPYSYTLAQGEDHRNADFGFDTNPGPVYVGDWVWYDIDGNGQQNEAVNTGIPCVEVRLWVGPSDGSALTPIGTTNTDSWGNYAFPLLKPSAAGQSYFTSVGTAPEDPDVASFIVYYNGASLDHTCGLTPEFVDPNYLYSSGATSALMSPLMGPDGSTTPSLLSTYLPNPGGYDLTLDFGFTAAPTAVSIQAFGGTALPLASIEVVVAAAGALVAGALAWRRRR